MDVGKILQQMRKEKHISQKELAELMTKKGLPITNKGISSWEKGITIPNAYQFLAMCEILEIKDINYTFLAENTLFGRIYEMTNNTRKVPVYNMSVSAGFGEYINDDSFEIVAVPFGVSGNADYGLRVNGDSMEPDYGDGELIWVQKTKEVRVSELGIFYVDGEVFFKELGRNKLISHNTKYYPIHLSDVTEFRILGKVVS